MLFIVYMPLITFLIQLNICVILEAKLEWEIIYEFTEYDKRFFDNESIVRKLFHRKPSRLICLLWNSLGIR